MSCYCKGSAKMFANGTKETVERHTHEANELSHKRTDLKNKIEIFS